MTEEIQTIKLELTIQQAEIVIDSLIKRPYYEVDELLQSIKDQIKDQMNVINENTAGN